MKRCPRREKGSEIRRLCGFNRIELLNSLRFEAENRQDAQK